MPLSGPLKLGSSLIALMVSVFAPVSRAGAQTAGTVGAVNPSASGTPPGAGSRTLAIGNTVVRNERLQTTATGTLHVTLSDRTTLNLGPNTNLVIDSYVYNPATGTGALGATMRSGLLRFVGGQTSHDGNATVRTPVATIGIRGNMATFEALPDGSWVFTALGQGVITVTNSVSQVQITRPGFSVRVTSANDPIPQPGRADPGAIEQAFTATMSRPGQTGGATRLPTNAQATRRGLATQPLPSAGGSALDYRNVQSLQPNIGRNSAQSTQPIQAQQRGEPQNPYGGAQ